jgi:hypothetical protein
VFIDNGGTSLISASEANWYWLHVGNNASGQLVQSTGMSSGTYLSVGFNAGSSGSFAMQGGMVNAGSGFEIGYYRDGTIAQTAGTISSFAATPGYYTGSGHYSWTARLGELRSVNRPT